MKIKYVTESHGLYITLFRRIVICLHHGVPGDWWFTEEFSGIKLYYPIGMTFGESDNGKHVAFYFLIFLLHIGWTK